MRNLYNVIQSKLSDVFNEDPDLMNNSDKHDLLSYTINEVFFEIDVRDYSFNDCFVNIVAAMNSVFDDYCYSECEIANTLRPVYLDQVKNLTEV